MVVVTNRYIHDPDIVSTALENLIRLAKANDEYRLVPGSHWRGFLVPHTHYQQYTSTRAISV